VSAAATGREESCLNGLCDGWLRAGANDEYAIGYYTEPDLPFFARAVGDWTTCDRYFSPIMAATFPNRLYMHAAQTDRLAVVGSPAWRRTVLVITYDEWGGFFDHVPPPVGEIPPADAIAGNEDGLRGFRVPTVVISPFARRRAVSSAVLDHTSILKMIEWRWSLPPLTIRDMNAVNLAEILDLRRSLPRAPRYRVPDARIPTVCLPSEPDKWLTIASIAGSFGWLG
jgi:phospholipase C